MSDVRLPAERLVQGIQFYKEIIHLQTIPNTMELVAWYCERLKELNFSPTDFAPYSNDELHDKLVDAFEHYYD